LFASEKDALEWAAGMTMLTRPALARYLGREVQRMRGGPATDDRYIERVFAAAGQVVRESDNADYWKRWR
jgi:hypothetical protein